ncbi:MAG: RNA repair transcriptional activator RtcR [Gammaproteobacteria bacterium]|nr:RNA repair transcriptional activator RtcR [Gammaproteobacteria bacterium]MDH5802879.1 RNA repair transcriptional activator RtcR [Gammaproteobacteria bacterium]
MHKTVVFGLLGTTLDQGKGASRWERWRPTVSVCRHEDFLVDRLELLYQERYIALAERVRQDIAMVSPETEVRLHQVAMDDPWDFENVYGDLHDFAQSYTFNTSKENYYIHITTGSHVAQICLFLLTEAHYFPGKLLQTSPPKRSEHSVAGSFTVIDLDLSKYDRLATRFRQEQQSGLTYLKSGIDTKNKAFNQMIAQIEQVAIQSRAPILLMGPTGAGKSQLARRIYELKQYRHQLSGSFVEVNCATLRGENAMSTLFGHKKGAFTGAVMARDGLLKTANGGILFLDELGELGVDEQAMLLRALEEKRFLPVGADKEVVSDFQLIVGTNRDLLKEVQNGRFREDLLARVNLWTYSLPGLSERKEDIEPNLDYELQKFAQQNASQVNFNKEARRRYLQFAKSSEAHWNGNFRDLNASVTRMATLAPGGRITTAVAEQEIERLQRLWKPIGINTRHALLAEILGEQYDTTIDLFSQTQLHTVIETCRNSKSLADAGRKLFSVSRKQRAQSNDSDRLRKYLQKFGLSWSDINA